MKKYFFITFSVLVFYVPIVAQAVWTIQDPYNNDIILRKDSAFLTVEDNQLIMFAIDPVNGTRNILVTDGDTSYWLLPVGFDTLASFTPFLHWKTGTFIFRAGSTWYSSRHTPETTQVFYDNMDGSNPYDYLRLFKAESLNLNANDFLIEAKEEITGDTVILYHTTAMGTTTPYGKKLRIKEGGLDCVGPYSGYGIIASVYNTDTQDWSEVGFYRQFLTNLTLLLPLGNKEDYGLNIIAGSQIVDHFDDGTKKAYQYYESIDSCTEITESLFPDYVLYEYQSLKWVSYGYPFEPPLSYYDYFWKGKGLSGSTKYFVQGSLGQYLEIIDLRNVLDADFMHSDYTLDSIYYYSYKNTNKGLVRCNIYDGGTKKEASSITFDADYKLRGYLSKMYFGRYNAQSGKIEAAVKDDIKDGEYSFLESSNGKRIEGPTDFTFLDDKVFVHSRTGEGLKLVVYDPDGTVATSPQVENISRVKVSPNPSYGLFTIAIDISDDEYTDMNYLVTSNLGVVVASGRISGKKFSIDLAGSPSGRYNLCMLSKESVVYSTSLIIIGK